MNEEVQAAIDAALAGHTTINLEIYYWWCTGLMIAIHAGFLAYCLLYTSDAADE